MRLSGFRWAKLRSSRPMTDTPQGTVTLMCLGQRERNINAARFPLGELRPAAGDHNKLLAIHSIASRRRCSRKRKNGLPKQFSRSTVERPKFLVVGGCPNEQNTPSSEDRATIVFRSRVTEAFGRK